MENRWRHGGHWLAGTHPSRIAHSLGLFLGSIFTTLALAPDEPEAQLRQLHACLDIGPTHDFPAPYSIDAARISYLTIAHKGPIAADFREANRKTASIAATTPAVCPWNKFAQDAHRLRSIRASGHWVPARGRGGSSRNSRGEVSRHRSGLTVGASDATLPAQCLIGDGKVRRRTLAAVAELRLPISPLSGPAVGGCVELLSAAESQTSRRVISESETNPVVVGSGAGVPLREPGASGCFL